jgi:hypothetical protein
MPWKTLLALIAVVIALGVVSSAISIATAPIAVTPATVRMPDGLGERVAMFVELPARQDR